MRCMEWSCMQCQVKWVEWSSISLQSLNTFTSSHMINDNEYQHNGNHNHNGSGIDYVLSCKSSFVWWWSVAFPLYHNSVILSPAKNHSLQQISPLFLPIEYDISNICLKTQILNKCLRIRETKLNWPLHLQRPGPSTRRSPLHLYSSIAACGISAEKYWHENISGEKYPLTRNSKQSHHVPIPCRLLTHHIWCLYEIQI